MTTDVIECGRCKYAKEIIWDKWEDDSEGTKLLCKCDIRKLITRTIY